MPRVILSTIQVFIPIITLLDAYYFYIHLWMKNSEIERLTNLVDLAGRAWINKKVGWF